MAVNDELREMREEETRDLSRIIGYRQNWYQLNYAPRYDQPAAARQTLEREGTIASWAVSWLRRLVAGLSPRSHGFAPGSIHVGFVVDSGTGTGFSPRSSVFPCQYH
jgi:hypothetical protein